MLREALPTAMKNAMKAGDKATLGAVRLIMAALKDKDIEQRGLGREQASDEEIMGLLQKMQKQRQDSIALYKQGNRLDLAAIEETEMGVIASFLPQQMDEAAMKSAIQAVVVETGAASMKDMGKVIAMLREKYAGQMDFGKASGMVKAALS